MLFQFIYLSTNSIIIVSRFVDQKNCFFLIDILTKIKKVNDINWFGSGPLSQKIKSYAKSKKLNIHFMGDVPRSDLYTYMQKSDLYLMTSKWEGIGVSTIEASYFGCKVIISDIPPHREIYNLTNKLITLVDINRIDNWISLINDYLKLNNFEKNKLRISQSNIVYNNFSLDYMIKLYEELYNSIL